jgi:2'-5' RNA ligase
MRLFVAIPLPDEVRSRLGALCFGLPGARWVAPENMHLTLRFVGEADAGAARDVDENLRDIRAPAFEMAINEIGFFDRGREVHTLWAGVARSEALQFLRDKVESAVVRAGFEPEPRKFKAHVTIARLKGARVARVGAWLNGMAPFATAPFAVEAFALVESLLGRDGARYRALAEYPLAGGGLD